MQAFFQEQFSKIAWRRVFVIAFIWTVFAMQAQRFRSVAESVGYGIGHGSTGVILLSIIGATCTKKVGTRNDKA